MPAYVILNKFTEQGIRHVKDTTKRSEATRKAFEAAGGRMIGIWWTQGQYDSVAIVELPDDESVVALLLQIGQQGNVQTQTLRAYSEQEMAGIIARLP